MRLLSGSMSEHPCFNEAAHCQYGRIHLPVAPRCNIQCAYCSRKFDCPNESRPGVTSGILAPTQAAERVAAALREEPRIRVVGIAGPGEPLANPQTFETLELIRNAFPQMLLCTSTNGLLLPEKLDELVTLGVRSLTVTVNAIGEQAAAMLYRWIRVDDVVYRGEAGIRLLLKRQREGVLRAAKLGLAVKINTVLVPGINEGEIAAIAAFAASAGAAIMNITPLIPCAFLKNVRSPTNEMLRRARSLASRFLPQFTHCRQCRADACGVPGEEEVL